MRLFSRTIALALAALLSFAGAPRPAAAAPPTPAGLRVAQDDHSARLAWDSDLYGPAQPLPPGVAGYKVTWGPASQPNAFSRLTEERIIQLQPLVNGQPYLARVQSVDSAGRLSAASASVSFSGDGARVAGLRARMNGFFDDFNLPAGLPDETKWNSAYSRCNAPQLNGFFINDQLHAHNTVFSAGCDRAQSVSRPRAALDFSDGGTRTIVFDFDGAFRRTQWYLDIVPRLMDISGQVNLEGLGAPADPADGLRIHQNEQNVRIGLFGADGVERTLAETDNITTRKLDAIGLKQVPNVRRHWQIQLSRSHADILIDGKQVLSSKPGAFLLAQSRYYLLWNEFGYNSDKANVPLALAHWDNFGFDAPTGALSSTVTHNYRLVNSGSDFMRAYGEYAPARATLRIPDPVAGALAQRLIFTLQMDGYDSYAWSPNDRLLLNGSAIAIPRPQSNARPAPPLDRLVSTIAPYTVVLALPAGLLRQGDNQLSFSTLGSSLHNLHAELDFARASAPAYTPPSLALAGGGAPVVAPIGPNAAITQVGGVPAQPYVSDLSSPAVFNPSVAGLLTVRAEVHGDIALQATGSNLGVRQVDLLVDGVTVQTLRTDAATPAPAVYASFTLDTRGLANGEHELYLRAYDARCIPSIADYLGAGGSSGSYYPLHISVRNQAAAVTSAAPAAGMPYRLALPFVRLGKPLQSSCGDAPAAPPAGAVPGRERLRDEQKLFVCDW